MEPVAEARVIRTQGAVSGIAAASLARAGARRTIAVLDVRARSGAVVEHKAVVALI